MYAVIEKQPSTPKANLLSNTYTDDKLQNTLILSHKKILHILATHFILNGLLCQQECCLTWVQKYPTDLVNFFHMHEGIIKYAVTAEIYICMMKLIYLGVRFTVLHESYWDNKH